MDMTTRRFPRAVASLPALVAFVREFFASAGLDPDRAFDLDLVLEELFTNMVRHARGGRPEIEVSLGHRDGLVTLRLRDEDVEPWDPDSLPPPDLTRPTHERRPGGLGIHLVREMTRDLQFEHQGGVTTVTATLEAGAA
jgi:anti-sigma regulatory factor (Ser/Thr protein kinase)